MRHPVPILLLLATLLGGGCARSHGGDGDAGTRRDADLPLVDAEPPRRDATPRPRDAEPPPPPPGDASTPVDAAPRDAAPGCPSGSSVRPTTVCDRRDPSPRLTVRLEGCYCGEQLECEAALDGKTLRLRTTMCEPDPLCDGCMPLVADCALPEGYVAGADYYVEINGEPAFTMGGGLRTGAEADCWNPAPPVPGGLVNCDYPEEVVTPTSSCIPTDVSTYRPVVVSITSCESCFADRAGCAFSRTEDGYRWVGSQIRTCECPTCGACAPGCSPLEQTCTLPPLPEGTHVIEIGDREVEVTAHPAGTENRACETDG